MVVIFFYFHEKLNYLCKSASSSKKDLCVDFKKLEELIIKVCCFINDKLSIMFSLRIWWTKNCLVIESYSTSIQFKDFYRDINKIIVLFCLTCLQGFDILFLKNLSTRLSNNVQVKLKRCVFFLIKKLTIILLNNYLNKYNKNQTSL